MKILYAIQGTGNGHLSRAQEVIPALMRRAQVDVLVSGTQSDVELPFPITYRFKGFSFVFGKNGGINYWKTIRTNNIIRLILEIRACKVNEYDLVINDFEPISAWASYFNQRTRCVALSHQSALLSESVPKPERRSVIGELILKYYAPTLIHYGLHFQRYEQKINLPIIRSAIRQQQIKEKKYYVVYLPSYSDEKIIAVLSKLSNRIKWRIFSKHTANAYQIKNFHVKPIGSGQFEKSLAYCRGVICGAGFETPAEALYLEKKLLVIPMKGQYEQHYNAAALKALGIPVLPEFTEANLNELKSWLNSKQQLVFDVPDKTQFIIDQIITNFIIATELSNDLFQRIY